ncbi:hypothetical protein [Cyanobium sp. ATX 6F1]|uniref:hypothetical protein n=1 Tax=unclassified Cyanobium TaxID=2627006 RepID=UPI0020CD5712|nr:hypothetical protein [Cyanobium sp. ATX 6F1]
MSQITIKLSDKADALIAQLQKEIFNRRRKKVSAAGVIETLVESGAKSQSDKRFATSWTNLVADIEKAAKVADAHGSKPANLTDAEWAIVLSHRTRSGGAARPSARKAPLAKAKTKPTASKAAAKPSAAKSTRAKPTATKTAKAKLTTTRTSAAKAAVTKTATAPSALKKPAARKATSTKVTTTKATASKATASKATMTKPAAGKTTTRKTATAKPAAAKTAPAKTSPAKTPRPRP